MKVDGAPCPKCGSAITWSLVNGYDGAKAISHCARGPTQRRLDFRPKTDWFCTWTGIARREKNGSVKLYDSDGKTLLRKRLN